LSVEPRHRTERIEGIRLHWVEAGEGPLVVLLHGFPEFWYSWRRQISSLAGRGFRVVAPDQRGYNRSGKPRGTRHYHMDHLVADVAGLVDHLGRREALIAGHDWGGVVAWSLAYRHPELVRRLAILNAPHPAGYRELLFRSDQLLRSWYVFFFQLPYLPEKWIRRDDYAVLERMLRGDPVRENAFTSDDVAAYREALDRPGALTAALNWYRANLGVAEIVGAAATIPTGPPAMPVLLLWGMQDRYLSPRLAAHTEMFGADVRVVRIAEASHWIQADAPERVNRELGRFFSGPAGESSGE
jgi:pimeloyl-ACP methyl ester carboxylesterase